MHNWTVCRFKGKGAWRKRASGVFEEGLIPQCTLGMIHIWCPWKLSNFQDPPPTLSIYVQDSSTLLTSDIQFQMTRPPLQMIRNELKENVIQGWLYILSSPSFRSAFIFSINSLILSGFPLTSFHLAEASLFAFSWLYTLVCAVVQKHNEVSFIHNYSHL